MFLEPEVEEIPRPPTADDADEIQIVAVRKRQQETTRRESLKLSKPNKPLAPVFKGPSAATTHRGQRPSLSSDFSKDDQARLDATISIPKFRPSKPLPSASSARSDRASSTSSAVGPESSSSESEDETGPSLDDMVRKPATVKKPVERRRVIMMDFPTKAKNPALERLSKKEEARRVALRLKPDISSLHRTILSWSFDHDGSEPPGNRLELLRVPDKFSDVHHYRRVFEPLLLMECWAQIQQSKEEASASYESKILARQYTDDWVDVDIMLSEAVPKDWFLMDTDIVLLKNPDGSKKHMAKVLNFKTSQVGLQATIRLKLGENDHGPQGGTSWLLSKVFR